MIGFLGACFFLTLAPTSSFVPIATEVGAERRMYLPLASLVVLGVLAIHRLGSWRFATATAALVVVLASGTIFRNREYESRLTLARTVVERRPHGRAHFFLGNELIVAEQRNEAMAQLRLSARDYPGARFALGTELLGEGRTDEGMRKSRRSCARCRLTSTSCRRATCWAAPTWRSGDRRGRQQFRYLQEKSPSVPRRPQ